MIIMIYLGAQSFILSTNTENLLIGIVLGVDDTLENKIDKDSGTYGVSILLREITINIINK